MGKTSGVLAVVCLLFLFLSSAPATSITGDISFGGPVKYSMNHLLFVSGATTGPSFPVLNDTGTFASFVGPQTGVTMNAWNFSSSGPISGLWSMGGLTFDLTSSSVVSHTSNQLSLQGTGAVQANGFDTTSGNWTAVFTKNGSDRNLLFSFQANPSPAAFIPRLPEDGSTLSLLLFGIASLFCLQFRKNLFGIR